MIEWLGVISFWSLFILAAVIFSWLDRPKGRTGHHDSYPGSYYYDSHRRKHEDNR